MRHTSALFKRRQSGFVVAHLFFAIAMMGIVAAGFAAMSRDNASGKWKVETRKTLMAQASLIRDRIILCGVTYPSGNNGTGNHVAYPATPVSGQAVDLLCPGNPDTNKSIWTGRNGAIYPVLPSGFSAWQYVNDATNMRISVTGDGSPQTRDVLSVLVGNYGAAGSLSGDTLSIIVGY